LDTNLIKVLVVDDDEDDFFITRELLSGVSAQRFKLDWTDSFDIALDKICEGSYDVYLLDYRLGERSGLELLQEAVTLGYKVPMILLTGQGDHEVDIEATRAGAMDYLVKGRIDATVLERSIRYAIERNRVEREKEKLIAELKEALDSIQTLQGLIPICASCKRIRDDKGYWNRLETYIRDHSGADFSHCICPTCMKELYPKQYQRIFGDKEPGEADSEENREDVIAQ
jgi:DNA-binding NtrC family response regulator